MSTEKRPLYFDKDGFRVRDGCIINLNQTVNGISKFYVYDIKNFILFYININGVLSQTIYEYNVHDLLSPSKYGELGFEILNGNASHTHEILLKKEKCKESFYKAKELKDRLLKDGGKDHLLPRLDEIKKRSSILFGELDKKFNEIMENILDL